MMRWNVRALLILGALALVPLAADAGNCTCVGSTLNMGAYSVFAGSATNPTVNMQITCNGNATYNIAFSTGNSGTYATRNLIQAGGDTANYNIYTDAARTQVWAGTNVFVNNNSGVITINDPLYVSVPPLQDLNLSGNAYTDTINVTMSPQGGGPTNSCSITLSMTVTAECNAPNATLAFGNYDPVVTNSAAPLDQTTNLQYTCTKGVSANIGLDNGLNFTTTRRMAGPSSNFLNYQIYTDLARTSIWTNASPGWVTAASTSKNTFLGGATGLPAYGRVGAGQDIVAGSYTDSVTATINY